MPPDAGRPGASLRAGDNEAGGLVGCQGSPEAVRLLREADSRTRAAQQLLVDAQTVATFSLADAAWGAAALLARARVFSRGAGL